MARTFGERQRNMHHDHARIPPWGSVASDRALNKERES